MNRKYNFKKDNKVEKTMQDNEKESYYLSYEKRYKAVYEAGADYWGHTPDDDELIEYLTQYVEKHYLKGKRIIEFFCGEGASGVILSKLGCIYHGVDISLAALSKAKDSLKGFPNASIDVLNVVSEKITEQYDAALDVMGIHMLVTDPDRDKYLSNAFSCLKNNAPMLFLRVLCSDVAIDQYIETYEEWETISGKDYKTPQRMFFRKEGEEIEVQIPLIPGRAKTMNGYTLELTKSGFKIENIKNLEPNHKTGGGSVSILVYKNE